MVTWESILRLPYKALAGGHQDPPRHAMSVITSHSTTIQHTPGPLSRTLNHSVFCMNKRHALHLFYWVMPSVKVPIRNELSHEISAASLQSVWQMIGKG